MRKRSLDHRYTSGWAVCLAVPVALGGWSVAAARAGDAPPLAIVSSVPRVAHNATPGIRPSVAFANPAGSLLLGETLSTSDVQITRHCRCFIHPCGHGADFTASGTAAGPYPGTFTAKGSWTRPSGEPFPFFGESFTIIAGAFTVLGTIKAIAGPMSCHAFGPSTGIPYTVTVTYLGRVIAQGSGTVTASIHSTKFAETFQ